MNGRNSGGGADVLGALLAGMAQRSSEESDRPHILPSMEEQRRTLRAVFDNVKRLGETLVPGQSVRFKDNCGPTRDDLKGRIAFSFWGYLSDLPDDVVEMHFGIMTDSEKRCYPEPNCLIAHMQDNTFLIDVAMSEMLEPDPDAKA